MDRGFKIALQVKAKHGYLQKFIEQKGWTQSELARILGISPSHLGKILNLRAIPSAALAHKFSELLQLLPEDIFPEALNNSEFLKRKKSTTLYKEIEILNLTSSEWDALPAETVPPNDIKINDALKLLTPREEAVLIHRYGLNGEDEKTLEEVGAILGVTRERVRQIEAKAIRMLRHPKRAKFLKEDTTE